MHIESFLKRKDSIINDLDTISISWEKYFYRYRDLTSSDLEIYLKDDSFYIEGCICIWSYGMEILSFKHWDLIDQLWCNFITSIHKILVLEHNESSFFFPDQPLLVRLKKSKGGKIALTIGKNTYMFSKKMFSNILIKEGIHFFEGFQKNNKGKEYDEYLKLAEDALKTIS